MGNIIVELKDTLVVDASEFKRLSADKMAEVNSQINSQTKKIVFVESVQKLKDKVVIIKKLLSGEDVSISLELINVELNEEEYNAVSLIPGIIAKINNLPTTYMFDKVPSDFVFEKTFQKSTNYIRYSEHGNASFYYTIGYKAIDKIWEKAKKHWSNDSTGSTYIETLKINGEWKDPEICSTHVRIGCQRIERYKVEQLALFLGLSFEV